MSTPGAPTDPRVAARRAWMSWSSGKDSAMALHRVLADPSIEVTALLTTVNAGAERVAMHGVRNALLRAQADRLGLPLVVVELPYPCPNGVYEARMTEAMARARAEGVERVVFGDLFLEDIRAYREERLRGTGLDAHFPLWGSDTAALAEEMLAVGIEATISCVDPRQCPVAFAGRPFAELLAARPPGVDPCGERGEFHTFVTCSPDFSAKVGVGVGEVVEREGFVFADLLPI